MTRKRYQGVNKARRDGWVRKMAEEMPQLTQSEIGQRFGLDQSAISRILEAEKRETDTRTTTLSRLEVMIK